MKKPTNEYTTEEIAKRLAFARRISAAKGGLPLDPTLEQERCELLCELEARTAALP